MTTEAKGGKKNRKVGRNKTACVAYANKHQREINAEKRQTRHLRRIAFFAARRDARDGASP